MCQAVWPYYGAVLHSECATRSSVRAAIPSEMNANSDRNEGQRIRKLWNRIRGKLMKHLVHGPSLID
jgi:hypothetical protein